MVTGMKQLYFTGAYAPTAVANRQLAHGFFTYKGVVCPFAQKVVCSRYDLKQAEYEPKLSFKRNGSLLPKLAKIAV